MAAVSKSEWGTKRTCLGCGTKFYDLRRNPITCPSCGVRHEPETATKGRRTRSAAPPAAKPEEPPPKPAEPEEAAAESETGDAEVDEIEGLDADDSEDDADVIEDPSELGEDEDDVAEVIVGLEEKEES